MINAGDMSELSDVFPPICQQEKEEIQALDVNNSEQNGYLKIYPDDQKMLLEGSYQFICDRIKSTAKDGRGVVFAKSGPSNSIDTWIFRSSQPSLFLTFITDDATEAAAVVEQNNHKAYLTAQYLKTKTNVDFKLIHSVVDRETSICPEKFRLKLREIESCETSDTGQCCWSLDRDNFWEMIKSFTDTFHTNDATVVNETETATQEIKCLVISAQQQETALNRHVEFLQQAGFQVNQMQCKDTDVLTSMDITGYNRLDLLVDSDICSLFKDEDRLKDAIYKTFREIGQKGAEIVLFNLFPRDYTGDDFNELFYQVPGKTRKRPWESVYNDRLPPEKKEKYAENPIVRSVQIGYYNKARIHPTSKQPVLVYQRGTSNIVNVVPPNEQYQLTITTTTNPVRPDVEEKIITLMKKQTGDGQRDITGVSSCTIEEGSIIIRLEMEPGQTLTDQWLTTVLQALFTKEVCSLIPDGVSLDMDIEGDIVVVKGEHLSKLASNTDIHKNCVSLSKFEDLQHKYDVLKWEVKNNERISNWMGRSTVATSSRYHSRSIASSDYNPAKDMHLSEEIPVGLMDRSGQDCKQCTEVGRKCRSLFHGEELCVLHIPLDLIYKNRRIFREKRRKVSQRINMYAASLLNTCGGKILIHIDGIIESDRNLEYFDELVMESLDIILEGSNLYTNTYSRDWLSNKNATIPNHDFVLVSVNKSTSVVTVDFKTKVTTDFAIKSPSPFLIMSIMSKPVEEKRRATIRGLSDTMHQNRSIVFKSAHFINENPKNVSELVHFIWTKFRLGEYVTAMSKIPDGGSYFLGILTKHVEYGKYNTEVSRADGFVMPCGPDELEDALFQKLNTDMCVLNKATMTFQDAPSDLIKVAFHPVSDERVVLEVAIGYFDGIVFSDKFGPLTFTMTNDHICRMQQQEWLERMRNFPVFKF